MKVLVVDDDRVQAETLARVLFAHFKFPDQLSDRLVPADGAADVFAKLTANPNANACTDDDAHAFAITHSHPHPSDTDADAQARIDSGQTCTYEKAQ